MIIKCLLFDLFCLFARTDKNIFEFKDKHKGEECFIVGTAPSLVLKDLELIKQYTSFSMNSIIKLFDKTEWRPDYYVISDGHAYRLLKEEIRNAELNVAFSAHTPSIFRYKHIERIKGFVQYKENNRNDICYFANRKIIPRFSINPQKGFYSCCTTVYIIFQLALYMGFDTIYLLGIDCDYSSKELNCKDAEYNDGKQSLTRGKNMLWAFSQIKKECEKRGVRVINCSRGGRLDVFERERVEDIGGKKDED